MSSMIQITLPVVLLTFAFLSSAAAAFDQSELDALPGLTPLVQGSPNIGGRAASECPLLTETHAVYTHTNSNDTIRGNEIVLLYHECDENNSPTLLRVAGRFPTGGLGSSSPIGSQNSTIIYNGRLFATNTISHDVSVFDIEETGALKLLGVYPSGGLFPIGLTIHGDLLYVLNAWDQGSIYGYRIRSESLDNVDGFTLVPLTNSTRILNAFPPDEPRFAISTEFGFPGLTAHESPSQVGFSPDGGWLIVVNKGADPNVGPIHEGNILTYSIDNESGLPSAKPVHNTSTSGNIRPFSFIWLELEGETVLVLTEADGPSASSYRFDSQEGSLTAITEHIGNGNRVGLCWNAYHAPSGVMFGTNAPDSTISSYKVGPRGELTLLESLAYSFGDKFTSFPFDVAVSGNFLYTIQAGSGSVAIFRIDPINGSLTLMEELFALEPATIDLTENNGLVGLFGGTAGGIAVVNVPISPSVDGEGWNVSSGGSATSSKVVPLLMALGVHMLFVVCVCFHEGCKGP